MNTLAQSRSSGRKLLRPVFAAILALLLGNTDIEAQSEFYHARGVIHLDTTVSGGDYTPAEMATFLKENDIEVGIYTDHDTVRWDYGFFPAKWLIGKVTGWLISAAFNRSSSVQSFGAEAYVSIIEQLDEEHEDVILLPGVEAIPFFFWEGSLLFNTLAIHNTHKHLLAFGLNAPSDYDEIPSVGSGFFRTFGLHSLLSLWPIPMILLVLRVFAMTRHSPVRSLIKPMGIGMIVLCVLFLTQNFPYAFTRYDQYNGDQGVAPYQDFIDFVVDRGGLVFWAHPEVESDKIIQKPPLRVAMKTEPYHQDLLFTQNYTGFSAFYEGVKHIVPPGGIWDQVLNEYATGKRENPIWAIAEGDVEGDHFSPKLCETVFLLREKTGEDALAALREGRIYAVAGPNAHYLKMDTFVVESELDKATSGQTLDTNGQEVTVRVTLTLASPDTRSFIHGDLLRNGVSVGNYKGDSRLEIVYKEEQKIDKSRLHYYRIDARAPNQTRLLSNPIFLNPGVPKS